MNNMNQNIVNKLALQAIVVIILAILKAKVILVVVEV
jgi:hypothetical protein